MLPIYNASFSITPLHEKAYQVDISFLDKGGIKLSDKSVTFYQQNEIPSGNILDIYSQNGTSSDQVVNLFKNHEKQLFTSNDEKGIKKAVAKIKSTKSIDPTVLVLDLKNQDKSYSNIDEITKSEKAVCNFYKKNSVDSDYLPRAKKIHNALKGLIDFVICEGSLKHDLLQDFSDTQAEWLISKEGSLLFCQYAEFYMNGFKFGQESKSILSTKYIELISPKFNSFKPCSKSTVWYPKSYKDIYSLTGHFMTTLKNVFSIEEQFEKQTDITTKGQFEKQTDITAKGQFIKQTDITAISMELKQS